MSLAKEWIEVARTDGVDEILRVVGAERVLHGVEVVEVAEELVEAVDGRQELVEIAEVVLAELPGGVALALQDGGQRGRLGGHADVRARLADRGQAGADGELAGDEVGAAGGAAGLGVVGVEDRPLVGELLEVGVGLLHDAAVVGVDVHPADVVAHDEEDVRLVAGRARRGGRGGVLGQRRRVGRAFAAAEPAQCRVSRGPGRWRP